MGLPMEANLTANGREERGLTNVAVIERSGGAGDDSQPGQASGDLCDRAEIPPVP
jgi:hypothetical protein